ncbi:hypothetical protein LguiA_017980 [Lonicera macranthoides]
MHTYPPPASNVCVSAHSTSPPSFRHDSAVDLPLLRSKQAALLGTEPALAGWFRPHHSRMDNRFQYLNSSLLTLLGSAKNQKKLATESLPHLMEPVRSSFCDSGDEINNAYSDLITSSKKTLDSILELHEASNGAEEEGKNEAGEVERREMEEKTEKREREREEKGTSMEKRKEKEGKPRGVRDGRAGVGSWVELELVNGGWEGAGNGGCGCGY